MERDRKVLFGKECDKLRQQIAHVRKDASSSLRQLASTLEHDNPDLSDSVRRLSDQPAALSYGSEYDKRDPVKSLATQVSSISGLVKKASSGRDNDVRDLQDTLRNANEAIYNAKVTNDQRYNKLKTEESLRSRELDSLQRDAASSQRPSSTAVSTAPSRDRDRDTTATTASNKPTAVSEFDRYCADHGGPTGGWDAYDHNEFLSFRFRNGPFDETLAEKAALLIPTRTPQEILQHEEWYDTFELLQAARKEAVNDWRRGRDAQQRRAVEEAAAQQKAQQAQDNEARKATLEKQREVVTAHKEVKTKETIEKKTKEAQMSQQLEEAARKKFLDHQTKLKSRLDTHYRQIDDKLVQIQLEEERKLQEAKERRHAAAKQVLEMGARSVNQAEAQAQRRRQSEADTLVAKARAIQHAEQLRRRASRNVASDPQRVTQHTESWNRHLDGEGDVGGGGGRDPPTTSWRASASIFNLPKLKLPEWRRHLDLHL
ncbi:coiled-coil domain-containing protein 112-like [Paramacrobiotus metropolitanus]|uniref:coiled-coil domain-containing protein 112-like n=1 Tax=Paramacrobiotus metropolitanus TaxID=2943436 RepID=UPI0024457C11|nr:coiled-coil domain-containing protein 112-like [Paramacrobiotus metropolitanus]